MVKGIPCLIILGPDGRTVNRERRYSMEKFGAMAFPFVKDDEEDLLKKWDDEIQKHPPHNPEKSDQAALKLETAVKEISPKIDTIAEVNCTNPLQQSDGTTGVQPDITLVSRSP
ncbi:hypothetical protein R1flu_015166 [Riccia fluitans]|uniref:Uncharacterized protein n=1 Tax=Riccia fluitans TaxID=41844 RepID=A0ABD1YIK3_9MARC